MSEENKTEVGQGVPDKTVHMINGTFVLLPFDVVRHIKALELQVKEYQGYREKQYAKVIKLEKERDEMKKALIDFDNSSYEELHKACIKHAKLIEKLKDEKS